MMKGLRKRVSGQRQTTAETTIQGLGTAFLGYAVTVAQSDPFQAGGFALLGVAFLFFANHYRNVSVPVSTDEAIEAVDKATDEIKN